MPNPESTELPPAQVMEQEAQAVQLVFLFTLPAGIVVLYAAQASAAEERRYELAVMRALLAHAPTLTTARYVHLAPTHVKAEFDAARSRQRANT